jgi:PKD repeat protein
MRGLNGGYQMKKVFVLFLSFFLILTVFSCAGETTGQQTGDDQNRDYYTVTTTVPSYYPAVTTTYALEEYSKGNGEITTSTIDRMVVNNGNMTLIVEDIPDTLDEINQIAQSYNGYVVNSNNWKSGERIYGYISIRIPAGSFSDVMDIIAQLAVEVSAKSTSAQDVTEQYVDLTSRLSNLETTRDQLLAIMAEAEEIEDILAIQMQLTDIGEQIEQIKGQMQYLEQTSATSLISVNLEQAKLEVKFTAGTVNAETGVGVQFIPDVVGGFAPYSYSWDFGDGNTSTEANPRHKYDKPGSYTITLTVTDDRGNTAIQTRNDYVTITQGGWTFGGIVSGAWNAFLAFGRGFITVLTGIVIFSPVWIVIGVIIWYIRKKRRKAKMESDKTA